MSILRVNQLSKNFGAFRALDEVSLEARQGEIYGYIGPNGSGKTTTIRIMLGILRASGGDVKLFGQDAWSDAVNIHRRIAYVPGEVNLWPELTGGEIIDLFTRLRGGNDRERRERLVERFDLDPTKKCGTYSKGNRQKVALVAAFASDVDLFILDEPSSGLDPLMEQVFQECVLDVREQGKTVFLSSHILSEVERLCDKVSIIRQGRIIESGSLDELRHLTRTRIRVQTKRPLENLEHYPGVYDLEQQADDYVFQVDSEAMSSIIQQMASHEIVKLESTPPTLEDLFLRHYQRVGGED